MIDKDFDIFKNNAMPKNLEPGELLKWRKRMGITQIQASELMGVSLISYSFWERGYKAHGVKVSPPLLAKMACIFYNDKRMELEKKDPIE